MAAKGLLAAQPRREQHDQARAVLGAGLTTAAVKEAIGRTAARMYPAEAARARLKEAAKAAEPPAKTAWGHARDGAAAFGHSVTGFFANLFSN